MTQKVKIDRKIPIDFTGIRIGLVEVYQEFMGA